MPTEQLIIRRDFPLPVTFADLRRAYAIAHNCVVGITSAIPELWHAAIKEATGAVDAVYAVIDGREVLVAKVSVTTITPLAGGRGMTQIEALLEKADEAGYWQRPHEVRHDIEETMMSHKTMARIAADSFAADKGVFAVAVATEWTDALVVAAGSK